jgi:hypothetical protein
MRAAAALEHPHLPLAAPAPIGQLQHGVPAHQQQGEESSCPDGAAWSGASSAATVSSRRRAGTLRHSSTTARLAAVTSHDPGLPGTPSLVQCCAAATSASWTASWQPAKSS